MSAEFNILISNNIYTKFFKITSGSHQYTNLGGTGIGLALAKSLTEKHGGSLEVASTENVNTVFSVVIPFQEAIEETIIYLPNDRLREVDEEGDTIDRLSIMIVEDDTSLIGFYNDSLYQEGYKVLTATTGLEALELLKTQSVDLVLSDLMMPFMDGLQLCKEIKRNIDYSHIPFILLTAKANSEAEIAGIENGADAYITKPFKWKHVTAVIKNLMEAHARLKDKFANQPFIQAD